MRAGARSGSEAAAAKREEERKKVSKWAAQRTLNAGPATGNLSLKVRKAAKSSWATRSTRAAAGPGCCGVVALRLCGASATEQPCTPRKNSCMRSYGRGQGPAFVTPLLFAGSR